MVHIHRFKSIHACGTYCRDNAKMTSLDHSIIYIIYYSSFNLQFICLEINCVVIALL